MKKTNAVRLVAPACSLVGVLIAFGIVLAWFPRGSVVWNLPLQEIDAPSHYYFIRRILTEGVGAALHLLPNQAYYPPMFHLLAAGLIKLVGLFGVRMSIYAAFNTVWLAAAGLVWPAGMQLLASYWTRRVDGDAPGWRPFSSGMALVVPALSVASACHPYWTLLSGPLVTYALATSLLPFWLYATLRLLDAIGARKDIVLWLALAAVTAVLCLFAHPRIAFNWLLLMAPFVLTRLPWKLIVGMVAVVAAGAVCFFFYMTATYKSSRYLNPGSWFHTFVPNRSVPGALGVFVTEYIPGVSGILMAVAVVASVVVACIVIVRPRLFDLGHESPTMALRTPSLSAGVENPADQEDGRVPRSGEPGNRKAVVLSNHAPAPFGNRRDAIALLLAFLLVGLVYVCSTSLQGWFANILTAPWYRSEPRPLSMIPSGVLPLVIFAACMAASLRTRAFGAIAAKAVAVGVVAVLAIVCQFGNTTRSSMGVQVYWNFALNDNPPNEQLTEAKYRVLQQVVSRTGTQAPIISDPMNGSMYGSTIFGANMLYPIYNPKTEGAGAIFAHVEQSFASGNSRQLLATVCPINPRTPEYFLTMGSQAPSLQMFTFKAQYDSFHSDALIRKYVADGALVKLQDFSNVSSASQGWALYRFGCQG